MPEATGERPIDLQAQVSAYLGQPGGAAEGTAAALYIGNNDYLEYEPGSGLPPVLDVLGNINGAIGELVEAGVGEIALLTLPHFSITPASKLGGFSPAEVAGADLIIDANNAGLRLLAAANAIAEPDVDFQIVDTSYLGDEIAADPETFGFKVIDRPLFIQSESGGIPVSTGLDALYAPDEVGFFDLVHPTTAGHGVVAAFVAKNFTADEIRLQGSGHDFSLGSSGDDLLFAGAGDDTAYALAGDDVVFAGLGDDVVLTGFGSDLVGAGSGDDRVTGGQGDDVLAGNAGDDRIQGGAGNDLLIGGSGADLVHGGAGDDVFLIDLAFAPSGGDDLRGGAGTDTLHLVVTAEQFNDAAFQFGLTAFSEDFGVADAFDPILFEAIDVSLVGIERVEIEAGGELVYEAGAEALPANPRLATLTAEADLWGLI